MHRVNQFVSLKKQIAPSSFIGGIKISVAQFIAKFSRIAAFIRITIVRSIDREQLTINLSSINLSGSDRL